MFRLSRFRKAFIRFATGAALFVLINYLFYYIYTDLLAPYTDQDVYVYNYKAACISEGCQNVTHSSVLLLGDSQIQSGADPAVLSEITGHSVWNAGLPAMQPEGIELLLPYTSPGTELVILNIGPYSLLETDNYQAFRKYYGELILRTAGFRNLFHLMVLIRDSVNPFPLLPVIKTGSIISEYANPFNAVSIPPDILIRFPQLANAAEIRRITESPVSLPGGFRAAKARNKETAEIMNLTGGRWTWNSTRKDEEKPKNGSFCGSGSEPADLPVRPVFKHRKGAVASWKRILSYYKEKNIKTVIIRIPFSPMWEKKAGEAALRLTDEAVREITRDFPGILLSEDALKAGLPEAGSEVFHDITHLSPCGAVLFTRNLGKELIRQKIFPEK